jgi:hypothetical protein
MAALRQGTLAALLLLSGTAVAAAQVPAWYGYAGNPQHTAAAPAGGQSLNQILWHTPVDLAPQFQGGGLDIHYGSPMITSDNLLLLPVKTKPGGGFRLEAVATSTGATQWMLDSDYVVPPAGWTPEFPAQLANTGNVYIAAAGGTVLQRGDLDNPNGTATRLAFYDIGIFNAHKAAMASRVMVDTPITSDGQGNIYFGFIVLGSNPAKLSSGIARIAANGSGTWVSAAAAAGDDSITEVAMNCAPAVSNDGSTIYIGVSDGSAGYLLGLDATTLATKYKAALVDPESGQPSWIADLSSASPTVGSDGDVYYGVLENPFPEHNDRGWLLHFDSTLSTVKTPGSFGWDDTVSLVPSSLIPNYKATGPYLLMTKYNNYIDTGTGDGQNKIAIIDPNASQPDNYSQPPVTVMKEVQTILGPTPNPNGGVYEWCINSAVVDAFTGAVFAGSEDGHFYRWDLASNSFSQKLRLNAPRGEAYTPSIVGPDGTVYAINDAKLYAIGQ